MSTITLLVLLMIFIGIGIYFWKTFNSRKSLTPPSAGNAPSDGRLTLDNVGAGGMVHLMNVGKNMEEYDVNILSRNIYREGENHEWYELEGDNGQSKVWISLEYDDELDVSIATRKLKLRDLPISRADLDTMDEAGEGQFEFESKTFYYVNSNEASFFRNGLVAQDNEEFFYYWEFETADEEEFINIEEWENGAFEVILSYPLKESQIQVYSLGR